MMMASPVVFTSCGNDDPMEEVDSPETKLDVWTEPYHIMGPLDGSSDSAVAETFLPGMTLTAAIPFRGQADRFKPSDRMVYDGLMASADEVIILSEYYYTRCFLDRDEFMVENASILIAFYDGREKGGTYYTFKKANCLGIPVVNIY